MAVFVREVELGEPIVLDKADGVFEFLADALVDLDFIVDCAQQIHNGVLFGFIRNVNWNFREDPCVQVGHV